MAGPSILILEDNVDLRRVYIQMLSTAGYDLYPAATLPEARALLSRLHPDVFLCDVNVEGESSIDLLREHVATIGRNGTRVVVVSVEAQHRAECEELGVDFYLEKPVDVGALLTLMERLTAQQAEGVQDGVS
jgi:CheY-like chemotaxis protein